MKKFRLIYDENYEGKIKTMYILAETSADANDFFFKNYSGMIIRTEFVGWD